MKLKSVSDQIIVITGASSGIGLATALAAARKGAKVVLSARSSEALAKAVQDIAKDGGQAIAVEADVASRQALERVAEAAIARFGRIDTWVNNAGVAIWGRTEEVSDADMRRLFETNFWGEVNGSLVAIPYLERQGGALINMGSLAADRAIPLQGIYSASKHAVKGFTDSLRMELEERGAPVSVTLIKPGSIGSPMPQHVKNYTDREAKFPPPVYAPEEVAAAILYAAAHPQRDVFVGAMAATTSAAGKASPRLVDKVSEAVLFKAQLGDRPPTPSDNLHHGHAEARVRGDHQGAVIRPSLYTRARTRPLLTTAVLAGMALAGLRGAFAARRGGRTERDVQRRPAARRAPGRLTPRRASGF